jgi:hypothetical protein
MRMLAFFLVFLALVTGSLRVRADDRTTCLEAASQGQNLRDVHQLLEAREQFRICAGASCPAVVQKDCAVWLDEVEKALPTVVFSLKDGAGRDVLDARVSEQDKMLCSRLDGAAVPMNPGVHTFRFEAPNGTFSIEQQVLVGEGQKALNVTAVLAPSSAAESTQSAGPGASEGGTAVPPAKRQPIREQPPSSGGFTTRDWAYVVAGIGLAGVVVGTTTGAMAMGKKHTADDNCTGSDCNSVGADAGNSGRTLAAVSTVGFGIGVLGLAAGTVLWFMGATDSERAARVDHWQAGVEPLVTGGMVLLAGRAW